MSHFPDATKKVYISLMGEATELQRMLDSTPEQFVIDRWCPGCQRAAIQANANPVMRGAITLASDCEYEAMCATCGAKLEGARV
jgi:hypothetical protein